MTTCRCRPQWFVDWADRRGVAPATPLAAARALDAGEFRVWLGKVCWPCDQRDGCREFDSDCSTCGWPAPIDGVTVAERRPAEPRRGKAVASRVIEWLPGEGRQ